MLYVGIDPSYSRTGVAYLDSETKEITFTVVSPEGTNKDYAMAVTRSAEIVYNTLLNLDYTQDTKIIFEEPLVSSLMASRLGILSGVVATSLLLIPSIIEIYTIGPSVVASMNRRLDNYKELKKLHKKRLSLEVVLSLLDILEADGYTIHITQKRNKKGKLINRKLTHDEAEAFLILLQLLKQEKVFKEEILYELQKRHKGLLQEYSVNQLK